ncbi:hypothetical protein [Psychrobacter sp. GP33]|uniref:hypothetical protein n=1 Tax=Psychrobacter sp. GP33 TaxID=2758709 RepID=UPI002174E57E|nr:hypothetical protein [Psychrobacter sp. GP33]
MDWLKSILQSLPLEKISDILGEIVIWWSQMVKGVPPADLPAYAYIGGGIVVLALWVLVARMLPRPLGGISWMVLFSVLFAPGTALSDPSTIAPASISVVYAVMMKDMTAAVSNTLPILVVLVVGLFIGFVWQLIRGAFESSLEEARRRMAIDTEANLQLAGGNYIAEREMVADFQSTEIPIAAPMPELEKAEPRATQVSLNKAVKHDASKNVATESVAHKVLVTEPVLNKEIHKEKVITDTTILTAPKKPKIEGFYSKKANESKDSIVNNLDTTDAVVSKANNNDFKENALPNTSAKTDTIKDIK